MPRLATADRGPRESPDDELFYPDPKTTCATSTSSRMRCSRTRTVRTSTQNAKFFIPDAKTDLIRGPNKIDTDQGESDVPPTPTKFFFSDATRSTSVVRDRSHRTEPC